MIVVVDTSALMAIAQGETLGPACTACLLDADRVLMSAANLAETLIVSSRRGVAGPIKTILEAAAPEIIAVDEETARLAANLYGLWGKGAHAAKLNYGDCFAYALAELAQAPLLYVGKDFAQTDVRSALPA